LVSLIVNACVLMIACLYYSKQRANLSQFSACAFTVSALYSLALTWVACADLAQGAGHFRTRCLHTRVSTRLAGCAKGNDKRSMMNDECKKKTQAKQAQFFIYHL
jgi:hypothetical protein